MTPEEHYERGLALLRAAEQARDERHAVAAQIDSVVAGAHFQAAAAGSAMRALESMSEPQQLVVPPVQETDG